MSILQVNAKLKCRMAHSAIDGLELDKMRFADSKC